MPGMLAALGPGGVGGDLTGTSVITWMRVSALGAGSLRAQTPEGSGDGSGGPCCHLASSHMTACPSEPAPQETVNQHGVRFLFLPLVFSWAMCCKNLSAGHDLPNS